jgi:hypothetical protein
MVRTRKEVSDGQGKCLKYAMLKISKAPSSDSVVNFGSKVRRVVVYRSRMGVEVGPGPYMVSVPMRHAVSRRASGWSVYSHTANRRASLAGSRIRSPSSEQPSGL